MWFNIVEPKKIYIFINKEVITTPWVYHNPDLWLITLSSDWNNWITIADKNLGATTVFEVWSGTTTINGWTSISEANAWKFFQWWNNYWFPFTWAVNKSNTKVNTAGYWPWNYYNSSTFVYDSNFGSWETTINPNLWWGTTWTNEAMRWPCQEGFHVPKADEFMSLIDIIEGLGITWHTIMYCLKMPATSNLNASDWNYNTSNTRFCEFYFADTFNNWTPWRVTRLVDNYWTVSFSKTLTVNSDSSWHCVRPFKNEREYPTDEWTVLFQPE